MVINIAQANAVAILNDLKNGLKYNVVEQTGPPHAPLFKVSVNVNGQDYVGIGGSKKSAKCKAAELALKSFIQFPDNCQVISPNETLHQNADFTSDVVVETEPVNKSVNVSDESKMMKRPAMVLNELYPNAKYECVTNESDVYSRFKIIVNVDGKVFFGTGMYCHHNNNL